MASHTEFNKDTTALEVAQAFPNEIKGKIVVITGANPKGLAAQIALAIASQEPKLLILASRSEDKGRQLIGHLNKSFPRVDVKFVQIDLSSQKSVRNAAKEFKILTKHIDVVINNAAIMALPERTLSSEGIEMQFATNHIGHFLLVNLLMDEIKAAPKPRVVAVSSTAHIHAPVRFEDWNFEGKKTTPELTKGLRTMPDGMDQIPTDFDKTGYTAFRAYGQSKTANILFALYLTNHGITAISLHPGIIKTELARDYPKLTSDALKKLPVKSVEAGASTTMVAAFDPKLTGKNGIYLSDCQVLEPAHYANNVEYSEKLWELSEELVGEKFTL